MLDRSTQNALHKRDETRARIRTLTLADEPTLVRDLAGVAALSPEDRQAIHVTARTLVDKVRTSSHPTLMEQFLGEYGLSTREGVALMCLAEALLRVPDEETIDALISDKITPADWGAHLGRSSSSMVNASTWALMLTGKVLDEDSGGEGVFSTLRTLVRRLGEPVVRTAVGQAMREMGRQFVLGRTIEEATDRAEPMVEKGYTYSYDMLGEAARTDADARRFHLAYSDAIAALAEGCGGDIRDNPGISVKLSALYPRYEVAKRDDVLTDLVARTRALAQLAASANMGFNIDAEEADRLDLSLDVIEAVLSDPALKGWDGFGVVVQSFGRRAAAVLDWLYELATDLDRRIMVRLVKGAYWDTEIKRAQTLGLDSFPVFTRKSSTDIAFIACARKLFGYADRIYPQFATHNAHSVASVMAMAPKETAYEFQRLHGMGEALHDIVHADHGTRCRIYAPVGAHRDLLAYLVRRLLENGANSSFVNQIVDTRISSAEIARDPLSVLDDPAHEIVNPKIKAPVAIFGTNRKNAKGWDVTDPDDLAEIERARGAFRDHYWEAEAILAEADGSDGPVRAVTDPSDPSTTVGIVREASPSEVETAIRAAEAGAPSWAATPAEVRAAALERAADLYEHDAGEFFALAAREAGKSLPDAIAELREAVDFLRYYANEIRRLEDDGPTTGRGVFACISPWNFPLAIFTGQIAAALAAGNAVLAKPAEQTPLIAHRAVRILHEAGIPRSALQLLPGDGPAVGGPLTSDPRIAGVCFTGSTETARRIDRAMAENLDPTAPLIAETGGLNAMIVDSSALPEQAVRDILASAFQSAGQRCSAVRILYIQEDVLDRVTEMLFGAMDMLDVGNPWPLSADVGPVIDNEAHQAITAYVDAAEAEGRVLKRLAIPETGRFVAPAVIRVAGIQDMDREIFGPVLHIAGYRASDLEKVVDTVNAAGYGLTFGLHTRIEDRVQTVVERARVGNLYVNRNQIGAIVGSQPFGGEGLSGTGPKAGGPHYVARFLKPAAQPAGQETGPVAASDAVADALASLHPDCKLDDRAAHLRAAAASDPERSALEAALALPAEPVDLPGPTGESNRLRLAPRGTVLCLGPGADLALCQAFQALALGNAAVVVAPDSTPRVAALAESRLPIAAVEGQLDPADLERLSGFDAVAAWGGDLHSIRRALAQRDGPILSLVTHAGEPERLVVERHLCVDTTAAGGNASLLAAMEA